MNKSIKLLRLLENIFAKENKINLRNTTLDVWKRRVISLWPTAKITEPIKDQSFLVYTAYIEVPYKDVDGTEKINKYDVGEFNVSDDGNKYWNHGFIDKNE